MLLAGVGVMRSAAELSQARVTTRGNFVTQH